MQRYFLLVCVSVCVCLQSMKKRSKEKRKQRLLERQGGFFILAEGREKQNVLKEGECKR